MTFESFSMIHRARLMLFKNVKEICLCKTDKRNEITKKCDEDDMMMKEKRRR
jgi:hypothetical protein